MAKINKKIMAFVGTVDACRIVDALADYTDNIYACVAKEYGEAPQPGGNITLLSKYLDEERLKSWIERVGVDIIIDGVSLANSGECELIKQVAEENGLEYYRIAGTYETSINTVVRRSMDQVIKDVEYVVGNILVKADRETFDTLYAQCKEPEKIVPFIYPDPELLTHLIELGCLPDNIVCCRDHVSESFISKVFEEYKITNMIMLGSQVDGLAERMKAITRGTIKASIYGDLVQQEGYTIDKLWNKLALRFGLEEY